MCGVSNVPEPAYKVRIKEIYEGEFEEISVNHVRYFRFPWGSVSKARVMGIVISSWISDDGSFARLEIHDGTGSIQLKAWEEDVSRLFDPETGYLFEIGTILDVIGRIRSWRDTVYLYPMIVEKVSDPNLILLRELEILRRMLRFRFPPSAKKEDYPIDKTIIKLLKEVGPLSPEEISDLLGWELNDVLDKLDGLRELGLIYKEGSKYVYRLKIG
ncbi:MAG: hypothetical protein J7J65_04375 [Candidatus Korarchaeota archaeon]|nr:hypothetical protein [Candidatus Korarchaeota archaeon]